MSGGYRHSEHSVTDAPLSWENIYDDGSRTDLMPYRGDLLRLDECGPAPGQDAYVL